MASFFCAAILCFVYFSVYFSSRNANDPPVWSGRCDGRNSPIPKRLLRLENSKLFAALHGCEHANFADGANGLGRNAQGHPAIFFRNVESLSLEIGVETTLCLSVRVRNVISHHRFLPSYFTDAAHGSLFKDCKETTFSPFIQPASIPGAWLHEDE